MSIGKRTNINGYNFLFTSFLPVLLITTHMWSSITTRKKLFRDQYLAIKWNGC